MTKKENPTHLRINGNPEICKALTLTKSAIQLKTKRKRVSNKEALHHLIFSNNGSQHFNEVLNRELSGLQQVCCIHDPRIKDFPFVQLRMLILHFLDGHIPKTEIMSVFKSMNSKADVVEGKILDQIKTKKGGKN